ncbi:MAG: prepilin-type N-terminal cleavage/methylation domain-containing protein [Rhodospirillales bacterium]|nr:prepilin-type N-terminal cleavage/methylation domain-containing protein [Rhodospirillales bacterium]
MTKLQTTEKGFTLVELAIVLVIVGLLIAGILKGQEMIVNSQITSTISQLEAMGGAVNTFKQQYGAYPGDMANASTRLINCAANPCNDGNGDGTIAVNVGAANTDANESGYFFNHLRTAELITGGFDGTTGSTFGTTLPTASIGGGYMVGDTRTGVTNFTATEMRQGPWLVLSGAVADAAAGTGAVTPAQAARIDRTLDDGTPSSGAVIGLDVDAACRAKKGDIVYDESAPDQTCVIAYRLPR